MSPNPATFLTHLRDHGYHSRSDKHSNALSEAIVHDLVAYCPRLAEDARSGSLVYDLNFTLRAGTTDWNVDLVLGPPAIGASAHTTAEAIARATPSYVRVAIELKAVMTEHRKAVKNRKRDLEAHHEHVHNYSRDAIAGGVLLVNMSSSFQSPLRQLLTTHREPVRLVQHCINELRSVATRGGATGYGLEAKCAIVVDMDNINCDTACYVEKEPAPTIGDPLHYDSFIRALCEHYTRRF